MTQHKNLLLWNSYVDILKEEQMISYKLFHLPIDEKIEVLKEGFRRDNEGECFHFILSVEPLDDKENKRLLTIGLLDFIILTAIYPGRREVVARDLLEALVKYYPSYEKIICDYIFNKLTDPEYVDDDEVYLRIGCLLSYFDNILFEDFINICKTHKNPSIKAILDFFER